MCPPPICSLSSVSISLCSMTQSLSGSGQTFCSLRGLSGPPPSAVCAPEMEAETEVYGGKEGEEGGGGKWEGGGRESGSLREEGDGD